MKYGEIIAKWKGHIPIVEKMPKPELRWVKLDSFMDMVRNIGFALGRAS